MREIVHEVLWFDRFALDLTRGCLQSEGQDIELRPKAFEVLRHLAANAGVLVLKQELCQAVWPNVAVSDDSLVQCIRELRQKLGDHEHRLIRTVSRRGYLLDASLRTPPRSQVSGWVALVLRLSDVVAPKHGRGMHNPIAAIVRTVRPSHAIVVAAFLLVCAGVLGAYLLTSAAAPTGHRAAAVAKHPAAATVAPSPHSTFTDCGVCPEMIVLPRGEFMMGATEDEAGRSHTEGPQRRVTIARPFALGKFEVTVDQFSAFASETGFAIGNLCQVMSEFDGSKESWSPLQASFRQPGFEATGSHPAVCISGHEAQAYAAWLRRRTGRPYRLPTEAEWEYAARAGTTTSYSFGLDETELCAYARFADLSSPFSWRTGCRSDHPAYGPLQVGMLKPNPWGFADMHGNAWEWVEDCWSPDVRKLPTDGSAFVQPGACEIGVIRGGSFVSAPRSVRSAHRRANNIAKRYQTVGFRVALSLDGP